MQNNITGYAIGELIENRYRVMAIIGQGGMGEVYRVADIGRGYKEIALKLIRKELLGIPAKFLARIMQQEFRLLTQLWHPNLIEVYDYGITESGGIYYSMAYVDGPNLGEKMPSMRLEMLVQALVQICRALAYLHVRGVIHGDLKPANALLEGEQVKLVDFGLAQEIKTQQDSQQYITPNFAAPELIQGREVDGRADLYSLGAIAYTWLVGKPPDFMLGADRLIGIAVKEALHRQPDILPGFGGLIARLLAQDPEKRYATANEVIEAINIASGSSFTLETKDTASSYALRAHFLGRDAELNKLLNYWETAQNQQAQLVLIGGESGVGKTRLVEELEIAGELEGSRVVWGQCLERGASAYQPWREVLRVLMRYVEEVEGFDIEKLAPVLATILPELWERPYMIEATPPAELTPAAAQQRLNMAIVQVLRVAAQNHPIIVIIEDAHWADEATQVLNSSLARILDFDGLMVCATYRSEELEGNQPLLQLSGENVKHILLKNLTPEQSDALVESMLGIDHLPAGMAEKIQLITSGNTFFVQELIRTLAEEGRVLQRTLDGWHVDVGALEMFGLPDSIQQVIHRRLEKLSPETQQALRLAAVGGVVFWDGILEHLGEIAPDKLKGVLQEGLEQEIIFLRDETSFAGEREFLFFKPVMQQVCYESIPAGEIQAEHAKVVAWLQARSAEEINQNLGLIANHLEGAGQFEQAADHLMRAGEQAAKQFANAEAIGYFNRALDLTPTDEHTKRYALLLAREKVYDMQGARDAQAQDLATLEKLTQDMADERRQAEVALRRAINAEVTCDFPAAIASAQVTIDLAQAAGDTHTEAGGYLQWGRALWRRGDFSAARERFEQALASAQRASLHQVEADCLKDIGKISWAQGDHDRAKTYYDRALRIYHEMGDLEGESAISNNLGLISRDQSDFSGAKTYYDQSLSICREIGDRWSEGFPLHNLGMLYLDLGDYARARSYMEQCLRNSHEIGDREGEGEELSNMGLLFHQLGDYEAAKEYSQQALLIAHEVGSRYFRSFALMSQGHALLGLGRLVEAADAYQQCLTLRRELGQSHMAMEALAGLANVYKTQEFLDKALSTIEEILTYLETETLDGADEPSLVYLACYRVLEACEDPRAQDILNIAYNLLQESAAKISNEEFRRSFLENVAANREIVIEYRSLENDK